MVSEPILHYGIVIVPHLDIHVLVGLVEELLRRESDLVNRLLTWTAPESWHDRW
jgi:hypothetical protein